MSTKQFWPIDLFKEVWVGAIFFWKMADTQSMGILSACNDRDCGRFRRGSAAKKFKFTNNGRKREKKNRRQ